MSLSSSSRTGCEFNSAPHTSKLKLEPAYEKPLLQYISIPQLLLKMMSAEKMMKLIQQPQMALLGILILVKAVMFCIEKYSKADEKDANSQAEINKSKRVVNLSIKKSEAKVVDRVDCGEIENLAEFSNGKLVMCRCWRSKTFPYCDGE